MRNALKPGGLLIVQGYTSKQLQYGSGGLKEVEHRYTRSMLEQGFAGFRDIRITKEELVLHEGAHHSGMCPP